MPSMFLPSNVTSVTLTEVAYVPSGGRVTVPGTDYETYTGAGGILSAPYLVSTNLTTGATTIKMPSNCTSITIGGVAYVPDGSGNIVVPAAEASNFLEQQKYGL
jgi:hypothetical protein